MIGTNRDDAARDDAGRDDAGQDGTGRNDAALAVIGWRELVDLPQLGLKGAKAKIDTGARTSSLHATDLTLRPEVETGLVGSLVGFRLADGTPVEAPLVDYRQVRSSNGHQEARAVIRTVVVLAGVAIETEFTLTNRVSMEFPILIGRQTLRGHFAVDPEASFAAS
jgi:hypothetical protein